MFLNNASALATRTPGPINNENAPTTLRAKSLAGSGSNNILSMKTPKNKDMGTQQRRRRALGDISNRKGGLGANNKGLSVKKQQSIPLKPKVVNFATPSAKQIGKKSTNNVGFKSQTPAIRIDPIQESKQDIKQKEPEHDYDLVLGRTTRWSTDHDEEKRSPFDFISKEELFMGDALSDELVAREKKRQAEQQRKMEEACEEMMKEAANSWHAGLEHINGDDVTYEDEFGLAVDSSDESDDGLDLANLLEEFAL